MAHSLSLVRATWLLLPTDEQLPASLLLDVFHLYKSGTPFAALKQINGGSLHLMHLNDYPQAADRSTLNDGSRI